MGLCHTEHDEGYVNIQDYQTSLDLSKAIYFEIYRQYVPEKYSIKYILECLMLNWTTIIIVW